MNNHSIENMNLDETTQGEMVIPSEKKNLIVECSLRHFMIQSKRNYTVNALNEIDDMKVRVHENTDDIFDSFDQFPEMVAISLHVKPDTSFEDFVDEKGDDFFEQLMSVVGYCDIRGIRGNRAAFITEFEKETIHGDIEVLSAKIILSTSTFYNDYRVTVGFPSNQDELDSVVENIHNRISNRFPEMQFETSGEFVTEQEEELT